MFKFKYLRNHILIINFRPLVEFFKANWKREKQKIKDQQP
jgi:hypothetical protein